LQAHHGRTLRPSRTPERTVVASMRAAGARRRQHALPRRPVGLTLTSTRTSTRSATQGRGRGRHAPTPAGARCVARARPTAPHPRHLRGERHAAAASRGSSMALPARVCPHPACTWAPVAAPAVARGGHIAAAARAPCAACRSTRAGCDAPATPHTLLPSARVGGRTPSRRRPCLCQWRSCCATTNNRKKVLHTPV